MKNTCLNSEKNVVPVFYACDDAFFKFTIVSIRSLIDNADKNRRYVIYILHDGISEQMQKQTQELKTSFCDIKFISVKDRLKKIEKNFPLRDYYSKTTYYRMLIADAFPEYDKAVYIDSDTVVEGDVSELFDHDLKNNFVGACHEQAMVQTEVYGNYVEKVMGINRNNFFNAGVMLINCKQFRQNNVLEQFIKLLDVYNFVVTQDEDYLNVICKDKVLWLDQKWNVEVYGQISVEEKDMKIIHYIMVSKPWHYHDCRLKDNFWFYAKKTTVYNSIKKELEDYTDEQRARDEESCLRLAKTAENESKRLDTYVNLISSKAPDRLRVLEKISRFEKEGLFDKDVESDPETITLLPDKVDYLSEKLSTRIFTKIANKKAVSYYEKLIKNGTFVIKGINGIENFKAVKDGAFITCNHFSAFDNYVVYRAIRDYLKKGQYLYKIIREGNFTNFKGLYGFFFRHCNTLPLSSNVQTMKKFMKATSVLLKRGEKILIYPEQAMWWNYKKPRPLKSGAFKLAVKNNVPIIPSFITLEDTDKIDANGYKIVAHTIWFLPPIYPKKDLDERQNVEYMKEKNFALWKELYESVYKKQLTYA